jgi:hypothetical protein
MAGSHGSVRREYAMFAYLLSGFGKTEVLSFNYFARQFQCQKRGMTLVKMKDGWFHSELAQQSHTAKSKHYFLNQTRFAVATI